MDEYTPKYICIQQYIFNKIKNGDLKPGDKIPSENILSKEFNVSRVTANRAIRELFTMGIVERVQGKGTFISKKKENKNLSSFMFSEDVSIRIAENHLDSKKHTLHKIEIVKPDDELTAILSLEPKEMLYRIIRTVEKDDISTTIDYSYVPVSLLDPSCNFDETENTYLHIFIQQNAANINPANLGVYVKSRFPNKFESKTLKVDASSPVLVWDIRIFDDNKKVIALTTSVAKSDAYRPFVNFNLN